MEECGIVEDGGKYFSRMKGEFTRKYFWKRFVSVTERTREVVGLGIMFLFFAFVVAYFGAHIIYYLANKDAMRVTSTGQHYQYKFVK